MKRLDITFDTNLNADKRGLTLKDICINNKCFELSENDLKPFSDLPKYIANQAILQLKNDVDDMVDKDIFFCIKHYFLFIVHRNEETYCWYNTYLKAIYEIDINERIGRKQKVYSTIIAKVLLFFIIVVSFIILGSLTYFYLFFDLLT
ncbi:MAG: hypothetical protein HG447_007800 [Prevotella sp.]|nr:hypothetical protein [Prevotella sp.]